MKPMRRACAFALVAVALAACKDDADTPYVEFAGGGFVFNYRTANHYYGFVARPKKALPEGGSLEVHFEVPGNPPEQVVVQPVKPGQLQYVFQTSDIEGIVKDHPYKATLKVRDGSTKEVARYEKTFSAPVDEAAFPSKPLVVGPGYEQPAP